MRGSLRVHVKPVQHWFPGSGERAQFLRLGRNPVSTRCPGEGYAGSVRRLCGGGGVPAAGLSRDNGGSEEGRAIRSALGPAGLSP